MKRSLALLLALIMVMCTVAACGDLGGTTTTEPTGTTTADTTVQSTTSGTTIQTTNTTATTTKPTNPGPTVADQAATAPSPTVGKDPILWLSFEEDTIKDGVIDNVAGEGLDATIVGTVSNITSNTGANALRFGYSGDSGYLQIKNADVLNFALDEDFTVDFLYMIDRAAVGWDCIFSKGSKNNGWYGVWMSNADGSSGGVCWGGDTGNYKIGSINSKYQWHRITVVKKSGMLYTYLDGTNIGTIPAKDYVSEGTDLYIGGGSHSDGVAQFQGAIDEFKIYDYAWDIDVKLDNIQVAAGVYTYEHTMADGTKWTMPYRVYYPSDFDNNTNKYPVVYFLHGHGEVGTNNTSQLQVFGRNIFIDELFEMDNCIIVAPQTVCDNATNKYEWVASGSGTAGVHQWDGSAGGLHIRQGNLEDIVYTEGMKAAEGLIKSFIADEKNRVDLDRVYVGGISMGGCATWEIIARNPDLFAAAVPLCGAGILSTASLLTDIDIWAFHGANDKTVWTDGSADMAAAIKAAGGTKIIYTELAGRDHSIWNYAYPYKNADGDTPAQWILKQKKGD